MSTSTGSKVSHKEVTKPHADESSEHSVWGLSGYDLPPFFFPRIYGARWPWDGLRIWSTWTYFLHSAEISVFGQFWQIISFNQKGGRKEKFLEVRPLLLRVRAQKEPQKLHRKRSQAASMMRVWALFFWCYCRRRKGLYIYIYTIGAENITYIKKMVRIYLMQRDVIHCII